MLLTELVARSAEWVGTSGRIETVRVRYALGGVRTTELPLKPAVTLSC